MLKKSLLANAKTFKVSIGAQTYCTVSSNKAFASPGEIVTLTVSYPTGYSNATVSVSPSAVVNKVNVNTFTFVMPFTDVVVNASASALDFRINVSKTGQGTVTVKSLAKYGEVVTVTASPSKGYELSSVTASGVTLSGSGDTRTFKMPAKDVTINVAFVEVVYELTVGYCNMYGTRYFGYVVLNGKTYGSMNKIPYWGSRSYYLTKLDARESTDSEGSYYWTDISANRGYAPDSATLTFKDGVTITLYKAKDYSYSQYDQMAKYEGEVATVKFSTAPDGYL